MGEYLLSFREVIPDQTVQTPWREISLNTGGTQSTLQDIKIAEKANGYCYKDATTHVTRNRFIYWRINNDILELTEQSLDVNLSGNKLRYKFIDTPILDGITIHETCTNVIILVPTVCSVHRLIFPHPTKLHKEDDLEIHFDISVPSIFAESAGYQSSDALFYVFTNLNIANSQLPNLATSWLTYEEEAIFVLAYPSGELILVKQQSNGYGETTELKYETKMPKFLTGMFSSKSNHNKVVISMLLHTIGLETYVITLCRDGQLRVWSTIKCQCIAVSYVLLNFMEGRLLELGTQNNVMQKIIGCDETNFMFAVYLNFDKDSFFNILQPVINDNQFNIVKVNTLHSPPGDLIDFSLTNNRIWCILRSKPGEWCTYSAVLDNDQNDSITWVPIALENLPNPEELVVDDYSDPRQTYLEYIFHPGRFPLQIISKALSIYKRSNLMADMNLSVNTLKQRVCIAVENEIQTKLQECEVNDEEYLETLNWCWSSFYSGCVQYYVAGLRPLGIMLMPSVSAAIILKKTAYSFLRPLDVLEHLTLCCEYSTPEILNASNQFSRIEECSDVIVLANVLLYIDENLNDVLKASFEKDLAQCVPPIDALSDAWKLEITTDKMFQSNISKKLNECSDLYIAMHKILELLQMEQTIQEDECNNKDLKSSIMHLFSSQLGVFVISQCFTQQTSIKFNICRNLLILQSFLLSENTPNLEAIRSVCIPETIILLQSYFGMYWLSQQAAAPLLPLGMISQQLSSLKLAPVFNLKFNTQQMLSLIELYARSTGGSNAHKMLLKFTFNEESLAHWHTSLLPYLTQFSLMIWPINGNSTFVEWLLSSTQTAHLQQYVTYINSWYGWNNVTNSFLLAVSYLTTHHTQKAFDYFRKCCTSIYSDNFIMERLGDVEGSRAFIAYYLKVIQLFELHSASDFAIEAADAALVNIVDDDEPLKATLYSIKFKNHLALEHFSDAFIALASNPDHERKKDNLRDFVKTLLDGKHLEKLMSYNYGLMEKLFFSILFTRARAADSIHNIYYDFLYAYCIKKEFMRLAASVMYEKAYRLKQHTTIDALEKQLKCYIAAVNALTLADPKFSWVLRPADPDLEVEEHVLPTLAGSDDEPETFRFKKSVDYIDLDGLKKEMLFIKARLFLAKFDPKCAANHLTGPKELVMFLASAGLFKLAFEISNAYSLPCNIVFEILTHQCVTLSDNDNDAWNWLLQNDLNDFDYIGPSPAIAAWALLEKYLYEYEEKGLTRYHRVIAMKMMNMGYMLPHWFFASYRKTNPAELLRLFYFNGYLEDAVEFCMDYLKAALGYGTDYFGLSQSLTPAAKPLCLPIHIMDSLIYELQMQNENNPNKPFEKEHQNLKELFMKYLETSTRISNQVCRQKIGHHLILN